MQIPFFGKQSEPLLGIDIGSSSLKIVELSKSGDEVKVQSAGTFPLPPNTVVEGRIFAEITMVGSISQNNVRWALVTDSSGSVHRVRTGNYLGKNYGRITNVEETLIEVLEKVPDGQGGWIERPRTINMNFSP